MDKPDKDILKACIKGNRKAQFVFYKWCFAVLMPICLRYRNNQQDAGSILNEGFFKILENLEKFDGKAPIEAWIKRIMINLLIDDFRKTRKYQQNIQSIEPEHFEFLSNGVDFNEIELAIEAEELRAMVTGLPEMAAQVFNLYAIDGYQHKEIGDLLGISEGTSKWHLNQARKRLSAMLLERSEQSKKVRYG